MAARMYAAARSSWTMVLFLLLLRRFLCFLAHFNNHYGHETLLDIGFTVQSTSQTSFIVYTAFQRRSRHQPVPRGLLTMPAGDGGEAGSRTRDVAQAYSQDWGKTPMDHLIRVCSSPMHNPWTTKWTSYNYSDANRYIRNCCVLIISESWLYPLIPDAANQLVSTTATGTKKDWARAGGVYAFKYIVTCPKIA